MLPESSIFFPSADLANAFDIKMRERLADSLRYLSEATQEVINLSEIELQAGLEHIQSYPILPEKFSAYYTLVSLIIDEAYTAANDCFSEILNFEESLDGFKVVPFKDPQQDRRSRLYLDQIDTDPDFDFRVFEAKSDDYERAERLIWQSLELLDTEDPTLSTEIKALLKRVMLGAGPDKNSGLKTTFDGASAPGLWGAILLNAVEPKDVVDMVQTLAHESCHNLLFGYCIDTELVENSDEERYSSPLRVDLRPIDGIFHATFVLARMHYAAAQIATSHSLSNELQKKAQSEMQQRAKNFYDGYGTLEKHALYTETGRALIESAKKYMDSATQ